MHVCRYAYMTAAASFPSMYVPCQPYVALTLLYLLLQSDDVIHVQGMYLSEDAGGQVPVVVIVIIGIHDSSSSSIIIIIRIV